MMSKKPKRIKSSKYKIFLNTIAVMRDLGFEMDDVLNAVPPEIAKPSK